jgi:hypothetical protein
VLHQQRQNYEAIWIVSTLIVANDTDITDLTGDLETGQEMQVDNVLPVAEVCFDSSGLGTYSVCNS